MMKRTIFAISIIFLLNACANKQIDNYKQAVLKPELKVPKNLKDQVALDDQYKIPKETNLGGEVGVDLMPPTIN